MVAYEYHILFLLSLREFRSSQITHITNSPSDSLAPAMEHANEDALIIFLNMFLYELIQSSHKA